MIANSATSYPEAAPHPSTLNDLRVQNTVSEPPSSTSALALAGLALVVAVAIGAFVWKDPLHWFTPTESRAPTPAVVQSGDAARPTQTQETTTPLPSVPATKLREAPI